MPPTETNKNGAGPAIAIVVVLAVIILGGLYFWMERGGADRAGSGSDNLDSIEADLTDTELDDIGAELELI